MNPQPDNPTALASTLALLAAAREQDLGLGTLQALLVLHRDAPHKPSLCELADTIGISQSAVTGIVDRFEKLRLAYRINHPDDRRQWLIAITESGIHLASSFLNPSPAAS